MTRSSKAEAHDLKQVTERVVEFAAERDWSKFHDPKNLAMALSAEAGELAAILRWTSTEEADSVCAEPETKERLRAEIGDVGILLVLLCSRLGLDLVSTIAAKVELNAVNYPVGSSKGRAERGPPNCTE